MSRPHDPGRPVSVGTKIVECPIVAIDFETTGLRSSARPVQVGLVRFEGKEVVEKVVRILDPGVPIPEEATAVHGIRDQDVAGQPTVAEFFQEPAVVEVLKGAAPLAYNAPYDRRFMPWPELAEVLDPNWPWLDPMAWVKHVDRFASGKGRHKLEAACARRGIDLSNAHDAGADAQAAGELFFHLADARKWASRPIGGLLQIQAEMQAGQWLDFELWLERQPPKTSPG